MKICKKCHKTQPYENYAKRDSSKDGFRHTCKSCMNERSRAFNRAKYLKTGTYYNKEAFKKFRLSNLDKMNANTAKKRAAKLKRTPKWLNSLQKDHILMFYEAAKHLSNEIGVEFQVDHVIPLQGKNVSGLHVPWNLQVISKSDNSKKSNKLGI